MIYENWRDTKYWDIRDSKIYHMWGYTRCGYAKYSGKEDVRYDMCGKITYGKI